MTISQHVLRTIRRHKLLSERDKVIVAVSGGPDSVALIHVLHQLRAKLGVQLHVAHINHGMRKGADADQKFVKQLARSFHLPVSAARLNPGKFPSSGSLEDILREARFKSLRSIAQKEGATVVALGHTRDDQAETMLMRIIRGTGLTGLQGIFPKRDFNGLTVVRPLLEISRSHIEDFLRKNNIPFRRDPSNAKLIFFRNKIRHQLLPLLEKEYNPNIKEIMTYLTENVTTDYDYIQKETTRVYRQLARYSPGKKMVSIPFSKLNRLHPGLQRHVVRAAIEQLTGSTNNLTLKHMTETEDLIHNRPLRSIVHLTKGILIQKTAQSLVIARRNP